MNMELNFNDAQQVTSYLTPQIMRINTEIMQLKYPAFDYADFLFVDRSGDMWDAGSIFYSGDVAGKPEFFSTANYDMPYADVSTSQFLQENYMAALGYTWHRSEIERASKMGQNLSARKASAALRIAEQFKHSIALLGIAEKPAMATGLFNSPLVPTATIAGGVFTGQTPDAILAIVNAAINAPEAATKETYQANTIVFPTSVYNYLSTTRLGATNDMTIMKFLRENNVVGARLRILKSRHLETLGAGATKRMMAYANEADVVQFHLPGDYELGQAWQKGPYVWEVPGIMNIGGTEWRIPSAAVYRDGL
jgi:hypothetical protein